MCLEHSPFGWWYSPKYKPTQNGYFVGFKESVEFVKDVLIKQVSILKVRQLQKILNFKLIVFQGPFDGVLGFSQGITRRSYHLYLDFTDSVCMHRWMFCCVIDRNVGGQKPFPRINTPRF